MRVFRKYRRGPRSARIPYRRWYVEFRDHREVVRRLAAFSDKCASEELGRKLERLAARRSTGVGPDRELSRFLGGLPERIVARLADLGLLDRSRAAAGQSIEAHLADFEATLRARQRTEKYVRLLVSRVRRVLEGIGACSLATIRPTTVERFLAEQRAQGLAAKTSNHLLAAVRGFTGWALASGLLGEDPLVTLKPLNARLDPRRERRALSFGDELPRLLRAAAAGPEHRGIVGPLRALVYRLAAETGLRVAELVSLRAGDLDLNAERPAVVLRASAAKNRREARIPLRPETVRALAPDLADKLPAAPLLPLPRSFKDKATRWLRFDLGRAGIAYEDDSGRVADFHALRASFVTALMQSGASPKVVQSLARHADAKMTLGLYSKLGRDDERRALDRLPSLPFPHEEDHPLRATGTALEGPGERGAESGPFRPASPCSPVHQDATESPTLGPERAVACRGNGGGGGNRTRVPEPADTRRLRA